MNYDAHDDAIDRPVSPKNEATPYAAVSGAALRGREDIYCNRKKTMHIWKKRRLSTEIEAIMRIFMRDKYYRMNLKLSTKNITMPRRSIFMNTCISTKRMTRANNDSNSVTKKTMVKMMITKKMKMRRNSGTRYLTVSSLQTLYCLYIYPH